MLHLKFELHFPGLVAFELSRGFTGASIELPFDDLNSSQERKRYADSITLWRRDGTGIKVASRMHDVRERFEVGVLEFWQVAASESQFIEFDLPNAFWQANRVSKLVLSDEGVTAETGIVVEGQAVGEIILVAGAYPYTLSILLPGTARYHQPEFELSRYKRIPLIGE
ncbi:MAG TPA: hypothetical protein VFG64_13375 [Dongiaceae bacterium]|jgi:hypothetical protein|nr:hypothetical protein [Dongiaceae bacterium]